MKFNRFDVRLSSVLLLMWMLQGCLPDSFTKFKEEPQKKDPIQEEGALSDSNGDFAPPVDGVSFSTPPTTLAYSTPIIIADKSTADKTISIDTAFMKALDGGEIKTGEISFSLVSAKNKNGQSISDPKLPDGIELNSSNGNLTGVANAFIDNNTYTIRGTHITGVKRDAEIKISIATLPQKLNYPQYLGESPSPPPVPGCAHLPNLVKLIIKVDDVSQFQKCQLVTSIKGAHGFISSVDESNNILFLDVSSTSSELFFEIGDELDSEDPPPPGQNGFGYFYEKAKISNITYSFLSTKTITGFSPLISPEINDVNELNSLKFSISPDITNFGLSFAQNASSVAGGTISGNVSGSIPETSFTITAKNINDKVISFPISISSQSISEPKVISDLNYAFEPEKKQIIRVQALKDASNNDLEIGDIVEQATTGSRGRITLIEKDAPPSTAGFIHVDIVKSLSDTFKIFDTNPLSKRLNKDSIEFPMSIGVSLVAKQVFGRRKIISVKNINNFLVGQLVSNTRGTVAIIREMVASTTSNNPDSPVPGQLYVDIEDGSKDLFKKDDLLDNSGVFVIAIDSIVENVENALQTNVPFSFSPQVIPELTDNEFNSISWEVDPRLPSEPSCEGLSGNKINHDSKNTCIQVGVWIAACNLPERLTQIDCENPGKWNSGPYFDTETGVFYGIDAENDFPPQSFTVKATNVSGVVKETTITLSSNSPPQGLSYTNNILLKIDNDGSDFAEKDLVSSSGGASGIVVRPKVVINNETYLYTKVIEGEFKDSEDLDNTYKFFNQKTRVLKQWPVSLIVKYDNIGPAGSTDYNTGDIISIGNCYNSSGANINRQSEYDCIVVANGMFIEDSSAQVVLNDIPNKLLYLRHFFGRFDTGMSFGRKSTDSQLSTVNQIISNNVSVVTSTSPSPDFAVGQNFSIGKTPPNCVGACNSDSDDATGTVQVVNGADNKILLSLSPSSGYVKTAEASAAITQRRIYRSNPINSPGKDITSALEYRDINQVQYENSFFVLRGQKIRLKRSLQFSNENQLNFKITPPLPQGLKLDSNGDIILDEDEPNPKASNWTLYTVSASNPFGTSNYTFGLKVIDYFKILEDQESKNLSGILHKAGRNFHREPCMVTQDQINLSNAEGGNNSKHKDILCYYDVGEGELKESGLKLKIDFGDNVCQLYRRKPYSYFAYQYKKTEISSIAAVKSNDLRNIELTGDYALSQCVGIAGSGGQRFPSGLSHPERCEGNYDKVKCDDGEVGTRTQRFTVKNFCLNKSGAATGQASLNDCLASNGRCSDGTTVSKSNCEDSDGSCILGGKTDPSKITRAACEGATGYWFPAKAWNATHYYDGGCYPMDFSISDSFDCTDNIGTCSVTDGDGNIIGNKETCESNAGSWTTQAVWFENTFCEKDVPLDGDTILCEGEIVNCLESPAIEIRDGKNYRSDDEENKSISYSPTKGDDLNLLLSNFVNIFSSPSCIDGNTYDYDFNEWKDQPKFDDLAQDPSLAVNNPFAGGNPFYTYSCLDSASNTIARIHLIVREWDDPFKAKDDIDKASPAAKLNEVGNDEFGLPKSSFRSWESFVNPANTCEDPDIDFPKPEP